MPFCRSELFCNSQSRHGHEVANASSVLRTTSLQHLCQFSDESFLPGLQWNVGTKFNEKKTIPSLFITKFRQLRRSKLHSITKPKCMFYTISEHDAFVQELSLLHGWYVASSCPSSADTLRAITNKVSDLSIGQGRWLEFEVLHATRRAASISYKRLINIRHPASSAASSPCNFMRKQ